MSTPSEIRLARKFREAQAHYDALSEDQSQFEEDDYISPEQAAEEAAEEFERKPYGLAWHLGQIGPNQDEMTDEIHVLASKVMRGEKMTPEEALVVVMGSPYVEAVMACVGVLRRYLKKQCAPEISDRASDILRESGQVDSEREGIFLVKGAA